MKQPIHILYISGFGSRYEPTRKKLLARWHFKSVTVEHVPMYWMGKETYEQKAARVNDAIDRNKGKRIVLIGESGGGSMVVNIYAERAKDLYKVMTICGKNSRPETVGSYYYNGSPAFKTSMHKVEASMRKLTDEQRARFVSIHPIHDRTVSVQDTLIPGCRQLRLFAIGHLTVIFLGLTIFSRQIVNEARR